MVWSHGDGHYAALEDRCAHRSAALSKGWLDKGAIVCPYHGWAYDQSGICLRIPQRPDAGPSRQPVVRSFACAERYGYVWVALDEPLAPIPDWPEERDPGYRRIDQFYEPWACASFRLMENSFDNAHIHFVHRNTFGDINDPDPPQPTIERGDLSFVARSDVPVFNTDLQKQNLRDASAVTIRHMTATWYMPFLRRLHIRYPNGLDHIIITAATPVGDGACQVVQFCFRNDTEADAPAANIIAFDRRVTAEDQAVLEDDRLRRAARHELGHRKAHAVRPAGPADAPHAARPLRPARRDRADAAPTAPARRGVSVSQALLDRAHPARS